MAKKVIFGFLVAFCAIFFVSVVSASEPLSLEKRVFSIDGDSGDVAKPQSSDQFTLDLERANAFERQERPSKSKLDLYQSYVCNQNSLNLKRRPSGPFT